MCIDVETFHLGVRLHVSCSRRCNGLCSQSGDGIELFDFDGFGVLHGIHGASRVTLQLCGCVFLPGGANGVVFPSISCVTCSCICSCTSTVWLLPGRRGQLHTTGF